ncbi:MAG TPA: hypothetical protein VGY57_01710 [Vicinamibacterales bacterium]|nr:hypothetical protein [Vicinamibacterales bacterium]
MVSRKLAFAAFGLLVVLGVSATNVAAGSSGNRLTYLTFNRPVALPGVTLAPGTYAFEVRNPETGGDIVTVRDRGRMRPLYTGFTFRSPRPANWSEKRQIVFGEAPAGEAMPILAWYPLDNAMGHEFIYRR